MLFGWTSVYSLHKSTIYSIHLRTRHGTGAVRKQHPTRFTTCINFHKLIQARYELCTWPCSHIIYESFPTPLMTSGVLFCVLQCAARCVARRNSQQNFSDPTHICHSPNIRDVVMPFALNLEHANTESPCCSCRVPVHVIYQFEKQQILEAYRPRK